MSYKILGGLAGLLTGLGLVYAIQRPSEVSDTLSDAKISVVRTIDKIDLGNTADVASSAVHDLRERNSPFREVERWNAGYDNTPFQDRKMQSSHTRHGNNLLQYFENSSEQEWTETDLPFQLNTYSKLFTGLATLVLSAGVLYPLAKRTSKDCVPKVNKQ